MFNQKPYAMRFALCLFLIVFFLPFSALAADELFPRGYLPNYSELPDPTPEQIDEALVVSLNCKSAVQNSTSYDCDCVGMKYLELRQRRGEKENPTLLLMAAQRSCPNPAGIAGANYEICESWAKSAHPYDYKEFCECFANEYASIHSSNVTYNELVLEKQRIESYKSCGTGRYFDERIAKKTMIDKLRDSKVFGILFPGAKGQ
ncbi:MAG TPA: hypothetical protein PLK94_09080 [Alphaproteobacteria bacterium]|nr:hypothetical protein [Alphaproteobacteria bacterium]HOO51424.1 hypothetical protein [Alphaproteobacteria bacterium]